MPQTLSKKLIFLSGLIILGTAITVLTLMDKPVAYGATPDGGTPSCGETCYQEAYQAKVSYPEKVCRNESVPVTHYYNTTRPVKRYYSYEQCTPGSCRTVSGWNWDRNAKGKLYKHYYNRQECTPESCRTVSGWNWEEETIRASYITWEPRPVCETVTKYKLETRYKTVCTPKACPAPAASQCSWDGQKRCATSNQYQFCRKQPDGSFQWNTPLGCPANQVCDNGSCITKPGVSNAPRPAGGLCYSLSTGYGTGRGAPGAAPGAKSLRVGENTTIYLRWERLEGCVRENIPVDCNKWGGWSGNANTGGGNDTASFSGTASANYNRGYHNFQLACRWGNDPKYYPASNLVSVHFELSKQTAPPPLDQPDCKTNECTPGQCWNSGQTRPCEKDPQTGNYCWKDPILSCVPGSHCETSKGCVNDKTGEPVGPPQGDGIDGASGDGTGGDGTGGAGSGGIFGPGGLFGPGGIGGPGGAGGPGFPAFGSTQCYDGKDNDGDKKIDNGGPKGEPADSGCLDSNGAYNPNDNSEFNYKLREIIPDFFNLNWFRLDFVNFFQLKTLAQK